MHPMPSQFDQPITRWPDGPIPSIVNPQSPIINSLAPVLFPLLRPPSSCIRNTNVAVMDVGCESRLFDWPRALPFRKHNHAHKSEGARCLHHPRGCMQ